MKKILTVALGVLLVTACAACGKEKNTLHLLNWGDYINSDVVERFEKENKCRVVSDDVDSNETMYSNIKRKVERYDIVVPSDYMLDKMKSENMLNEIDKTKLTNYSEGMFINELETLMNNDGQAYKDYFIPYFWGTLGIMYNNSKTGIKEAVETNGWAVFFDDTIELPSNTTIGMYDCARDAFACAELYKGYSLNETDDTKLKECRDLLKDFEYEKYGTDDLKTSIADKTLDIALVYSGDFFDQRYQYIENEKEVTFGFYAPTNNNNVFYDGLAIPKTCDNMDLAYKFIDFMLDKDNSFENTDYVGYAPVIESVKQEFIDLAAEETDDTYYTDLLAINAFNPALVVNAEVYKFLGTAIDTKIEDYFETARQ